MSAISSLASRGEYRTLFPNSRCLKDEGLLRLAETSEIVFGPPGADEEIADFSRGQRTIPGVVVDDHPATIGMPIDTRLPLRSVN